jgi:hypothetical protein
MRSVSTAELHLPAHLGSRMCRILRSVGPNYHTLLTVAAMKEKGIFHPPHHIYNFIHLAECAGTMHGTIVQRNSRAATLVMATMLRCSVLDIFTVHIRKSAPTLYSMNTRDF